MLQLYTTVLLFIGLLPSSHYVGDITVASNGRIRWDFHWRTIDIAYTMYSNNDMLYTIVIDREDFNCTSATVPDLNACLGKLSPFRYKSLSDGPSKILSVSQHNMKLDSDDWILLLVSPDTKKIVRVSYDIHVNSVDPVVKYIVFVMMLVTIGVSMVCCSYYCSIPS